MPDRSENAQPLERLHASLFLLMNRYTEVACPVIALAVSDRIHQILRHPLIDLFPELRSQLCACRQTWQRRALALEGPQPEGFSVH